MLGNIPVPWILMILIYWQYVFTVYPEFNSSNIWTMEAWKTTPVSFQRRTVKLRGVYRQSKLWNQRNNAHRIYMSWLEDSTILFVWCDLFHQQFRLWLFGFNGQIDLQGYTSAMDPYILLHTSQQKHLQEKKPGFACSMLGKSPKYSHKPWFDDDLPW